MVTAHPTPDYPISPRRNYGSWFIVAVAVLIVALLVLMLVRNTAFAWDAVLHYLFHPLILSGLAVTLQLTVVVLVCALVLATLVAMLRLSSSRVLQAIGRTYVWFFRGVPALIQLIFWYNIGMVVPVVSLTLPGVGTLFSINTNDVISPFIAAVIALSLCEAGYLAEIIRAGIKSVPSGQVEAARALGMSRGRTLRRIVVPQAMPFIIPPTGNEAISLLKMTSLVAYIAVDDLFYTAQSIYSRTFETIPLLVVVAVWYLVAVTILTIGQGYLERYYGRMDDPLPAGMAYRVWRVALAARHRSSK